MTLVNQIVHFLWVFAHDGNPWISSSSLTCQGKESCNREGTGYVDVQEITCSGIGACRGFEVEVSKSMICSGDSACENIPSSRREATMTCQGVGSCSNVLGWKEAGNLGDYSTLRTTYPQTHYQLGIEVGNIVYPAVDQTWAGTNFIVTGEIIHGDDPRAFKLAQYIYAKGLLFNSGLTDSGATASTWYRFLYEQHGTDSNVESFAIMSNDGAQVSTSVKVNFQKYHHHWEEIGTVSSYTTLRETYLFKEWHFAVEIDGPLCMQ